MDTIRPTTDNVTVTRQRTVSGDTPGFDAGLRQIARHLEDLADRLDTMPQVQRALLLRITRDLRGDLSRIRLDVPAVTR